MILALSSVSLEDFHHYSETLYARMSKYPKMAVDIIWRLLQLNPEHRATADDALKYPYWWNPPNPIVPGPNAPPLPSAHEYDSKMAIDRREIRQRDALNYGKQQHDLLSNA